MTRDLGLLALAGILAIGLAVPDAAGAQTRGGICDIATDTAGGGSGSGGASGPTDYSGGSREVIYVRGNWSCPPVSTEESGSSIYGLGHFGQHASATQPVVAPAMPAVSAAPSSKGSRRDRVRSNPGRIAGGPRAMPGTVVHNVSVQGRCVCLRVPAFPLSHYGLAKDLLN
jgi:hypothetical protein